MFSYFTTRAEKSALTTRLSTLPLEMGFLGLNSQNCGWCLVLGANQSQRTKHANSYAKEPVLAKHARDVQSNACEARVAVPWHACKAHPLRASQAPSTNSKRLRSTCANLNPFYAEFARCYFRTQPFSTFYKFVISPL